MTVLELITELQRLADEGRGKQPVFLHRWGDNVVMQAERVSKHHSAKIGHVVIAAPNPKILWPNGELNAVCPVEEAMQETPGGRE